MEGFLNILFLLVLWFHAPTIFEIFLIFFDIQLWQLVRQLIGIFFVLDIKYHATLWRIKPILKS